MTALAGVSGEIARPASILCEWTSSMTFSGSSVLTYKYVCPWRTGGTVYKENIRRTGSFIVECIEFSTRLGNFRNPLSRVGNHHVAVHKDVGDILVDVFKNGRAHGDVGDKVAIHDVYIGTL